MDDPDVLLDLARCHAGLAQWDKAERAYREALEQLSRDPSRRHWYADRPWHELFGYPMLYERVASIRENDYWRWMASARRAVVAGQWPAAVGDYLRARQCPHVADPDCDFEYALSRLLAGDSAEQRHVCARLFAADERVLEEEGETAADRRNWQSATHLCFAAPQGAVNEARIAKWLEDHAASWWKVRELQPLILCRVGMFGEALKHKPPKGDEYGGRYWFAIAMGHKRLGNWPEARECFARGARWLNRRMRADRVDAYYNDASLLLEAEVLRREAERLIDE